MAWDSGLKFVKCGLVEENKPIVKLSLNAVVEIYYLMSKFRTIEWAADLIGSVKNNTFFIKELYIFDQEVTESSIKRLEDCNKKFGKYSVIGVIHSHHHMSSKFSNIDMEFANQNHLLSGVVSHCGLMFDISFVAKAKTKCGCYTLVPCKVEIDIPDRVISKFEDNSYKFKYIEKDTLFIKDLINEPLKKLG